MALDLDPIAATVHALRPLVDAYITPERVRRYLSRISDMPAPSTAASAMRLPVLRQLLEEDGVLARRSLHLHGDFAGTGSTVLLTGSADKTKPIWYFAHLDTISYLVQPIDGERYPLVPFCYHMIGDGRRTARAYRYDLAAGAYIPIAEGWLDCAGGVPFFVPARPEAVLRPGDRVVPVTSYREDGGDGAFTGHVDNAGGVAALAVAAPVLAEAGVDALIAFPDEEEGPRGSGNQMMGRGGSRIIHLLPTPELAVIADVQQAGGGEEADTHGGIENSTRLGAGAVLAEFSSFARGAVTPPHLYALARHVAGLLEGMGVPVQESNNAYSSRSDEVSVVLRTPNILMLGFPGFNRHFDRGEPRANLHDVVALSRLLVYMSALRPALAEHKHRLTGARA